MVARENDMAFNTDLRYCSTVGDLYQIWRTVKDKKLVRAETLKMMSTAEGPGEHMSAQDSQLHYGMALTLNHEDDHRSVGQHCRPPVGDVPLVDQSVSVSESKQLTGMFLLTVDKVPVNLHDSFAQYRRTYRVFDENEGLMIEPLGQGAEHLFKLSDGSFAMRSASKTRISFVLRDGRAVSMKMDSPGGLGLVGERVGEGDPQTFHQQLR